jgi:ribosomal peptide maturation radical SAM protein 1
MPFASVERPSLGVSALKARLAEVGIPCDVSYENVAFAERLGHQEYGRVCDCLPEAALAGEWVFTGCLYGRDREPTGSYLDDVLRRGRRPDAANVAAVAAARALAPAFVAYALTSLPWSRYDVVGFTSSGAQNIASLALARLVAERHPSVHIAFGGANWEGPMGRELHRRFSFVHSAFSGEADRSFPDLLLCLGNGGDRAPAHIPGTTLRQGGKRWTTAAGSPISDLDALPIPDHSDYFEALLGSGLAGRFDPVVPLETARGCWWGARHPCRFCGLNGSSRSFRTKSPPRIMKELRELARRHPGCDLDIADNLVSPEFLGAVLPQLAAQRTWGRLSFKVRTDLGREQVTSMSSVGPSVCAGVESLSDGLLQLMGKGTASLENIRFLRWCKTGGIGVRWNLIHSFPGESWRDYAQMLELLPWVSHLDSPEGCGPVQVERFSRYAADPSSHGFVGTRPALAYRYLFPFSEASLRRIAYYFDHDYRPGLVESIGIDRLGREVREWREERGSSRGLWWIERESGEQEIVDTRRAAVSGRYTLDSLERSLYEACDDIRSRDELYALARGELGAAGYGEEEVDRRLSFFVEHGLMVTDGNRYLSLALRARPASAADETVG